MQNPFTQARIQGLTERIEVKTRQQLVRVTRDKTAENQQAITALTGRPAPFSRTVDGSPGKPLEAAEHFTLTEFDLTGGVVDEIIATLMRNSPYGPEERGHYRDDHWLFVNGQRRDAGQAGIVEIGKGDTVVIINTRPYARKIEGGARGRRRPGLSVQAPSGVYEISAAELRRRFGALVRIRFVYRNVSGLGGRFPALEISALAA